MAEQTALRNNALPYPVYGAPWGLAFPILDADGDLVTGAAGLDSEISKNADTMTDCTNEATEIATSSGMYYLLLTGTELTTDVATIIVKTSTTGAKTTPLVLYPKKLPAIRSGTAAGGAAGSITLDSGASPVDQTYKGLLCVATIDGNLEARIITGYTGSTKVATVTPDWNVTPDSDDTFILSLPDGMQIPTVDVVAWLTNAAATPTVAGVPEVDVTHWIGSAVPLPTASGVPVVDVVRINGSLTSGNNATLSLKQLNIVNNAGSAIVASSTGSDGHGIAASGNGGGDGIRSEGGDTGHGVEAIGGASGGNGAQIQGVAGFGLNIVSDVADALKASGGVNGAGILAEGAGTGSGITALGTGANCDGLTATGFGTGKDINAPNSDIGGVTVSVVDTGAITSTSFAAGAIDAAALATDAVTEIATGVWAFGTRTLTSFGTLVADVATAVWAAATRTLTSLAGNAADIRAAVGLASANLDTQLAAIKADTAAILIDTNIIEPLVSTNLNATVSSRATPAQVNAEVLDVLTVDTFTEPTGVPAVSVSLGTKIGYLYMVLRNGIIVDSNTGKLQFLDDGLAAEWEKDFTDAAGIYTESEANAP